MNLRRSSNGERQCLRRSHGTRALQVHFAAGVDAVVALQHSKGACAFDGDGRGRPFFFFVGDQKTRGDRPTYVAAGNSGLDRASITKDG